MRRSTTRRGARPAGASVRVRPCGLSVGLRLRRRGFDSSCAPKGPRPGGGRARWAGFSGCDLRGTQDSAFVSWEPRLLRSLRNPVTNAEAFGLQLTKEESWAPLGVGWAALLPSRGTVHEKEEALPPPPPSAVDPPPFEPWEGWQIHRRHRFGGRATAQGAGTQNIAPHAAHSTRTRAAAAPSRPVEALSETTPTRSRASAAPLERRAAQPQPQLDEKPRRRSRRTSGSTRPPGRGPGGLGWCW